VEEAGIIPDKRQGGSKDTGAGLDPGATGQVDDMLPVLDELKGSLAQVSFRGGPKECELIVAELRICPESVDDVGIAVHGPNPFRGVSP
jgi:hypothetical protein